MTIQSFMEFSLKFNTVKILSQDRGISRYVCDNIDAFTCFSSSTVLVSTFSTSWSHWSATRFFYQWGYHVQLWRVFLDLLIGIKLNTPTVGHKYWFLFSCIMENKDFIANRHKLDKEMTWTQFEIIYIWQTRCSRGCSTITFVTQ